MTTAVASFKEMPLIIDYMNETKHMIFQTTKSKRRSPDLKRMLRNNHKEKVTIIRFLGQINVHEHLN